MVTLDAKEISKFISKIDIKTNDECWNWKASCMNSGYGQFMLYRKGKTVALSAHRVSYLIFKGEIPKGLQINHTCDNKICANPNHLYAGTSSENNFDAVRRHRHKSNNLIGMKNPKAKLSDEDIIQIRKIWAEKYMRRYQLAELYGVCEQTIYRIIKRHGWNHIP